jgi:HK97 family phage major capsid protein
MAPDVIGSEVESMVASLRPGEVLLLENVRWPAQLREKAMKSAKQIQEMLAESRDELEAIVAVATKEERELSDDEQARVAAITDEEIPKLNKSLELVQKIDAEKHARAASRMSAQIDRQQLEEIDEPAAKRAQIKVPARAKAHGNLKAFKGEDAERDAYVSGQVILAGIYGNERAVEFCQNHGLVKGTMTGGISGAKGGFLVPDEMAAALVRLREERGVFTRYARSIPMGSDNINVPRLIGDVTAYWSGEGSEITDSDADLGSAELVAKKLASLTKVSTELDEDSVGEIGDMLTTSMAYAMADKIDQAGFNGDGTSTYGGVTGLANALDSAAVQDAVSGNVSAATLDLADFEATLALLPQYEGASPRWFINSAAYWNGMGRLLNAAGGNAVSDLTGEREMMFLGYPVTFSQVMSTGTAVSTIVAYLGDLGLAATVGTRRSVQTAVSVDRYFENDLIGIRCTERIAINVHERGDTVRTRPIVALKTAAS